MRIAFASMPAVTQAKEVLGKPFWLAGWWRGSPEVQEKIRSRLPQGAQGTPYRAELPYHWADGTERLVEFELHPSAMRRSE